MGKSDGMPEGVKMAIYWALGIGIIALVVLVLSVLFGNLVGNLGFAQDSTAFRNETITLTDAGNTPATAQGRVSASLSNVIVTNASGGELITTVNYTLTGVVFTSKTLDYNDTAINISATVTYDSQGKRDTENIIQNYTESGTNVSAQLPTVGTIIGVAILLAVLLGVLIFAIRKMLGVTKSASSSGKKGSFGESSSDFA